MLIRVRIFDTRIVRCVENYKGSLPVAPVLTEDFRQTHAGTRFQAVYRTFGGGFRLPHCGYRSSSMRSTGAAGWIQEGQPDARHADTAVYWRIRICCCGRFKPICSGPLDRRCWMVDRALMASCPEAVNGKAGLSVSWSQAASNRSRMSTRGPCHDSQHWQCCL